MSKVLYFLWALLLAFPHALPVSAAEASGSISLSLPGGDMRLYQVAELTEDGTSCLLTGDFSGWSGSLEDLSASLARELAQYALDNSCACLEARPSKDGSILFSGLEPGLYLLVQTEAASGYEKMAPFLVSLTADPFHVNASPKFQLTPLPTQPLPSLPQTGQSNWPIPVLGISGILLFLTGLILERRRHG